MYLGPGRARHKEAVHSGLAWVLAGFLLAGIKRELDRVFTKGGNGWIQTDAIATREAAMADCAGHAGTRSSRQTALAGCVGARSSFQGLCCTLKKCLANCVPSSDHEDLHQLVPESVFSSLSNSYVLFMTDFWGHHPCFSHFFPFLSTGVAGSPRE